MSEFSIACKVRHEVRYEGKCVNFEVNLNFIRKCNRLPESMSFVPMQTFYLSYYRLFVTFPKIFYPAFNRARNGDKNSFGKTFSTSRISACC